MCVFILEPGSGISRGPLQRKKDLLIFIFYCVFKVMAGMIVMFWYWWWDDNYDVDVMVTTEKEEEDECDNDNVCSDDGTRDDNNLNIK